MHRKIALRYFKQLQASGLSRLELLRLESDGSAAANQSRSVIKIYDRFFDHTLKVQRHILAHELGHWHREHHVKLSDIMGWEGGEGFYGVYGMPNVEEGYAEAFAAYLINPSDLKTKYPENWSFLKGQVGNITPYLSWVNTALAKALDLPYGIRQKVSTRNLLPSPYLLGPRP